MCEPLFAFMHFDESYPGSSAAQLGMIAVFLLLGFVPILIGTLLSPGNRLREAGLTILISLGVAGFCALSILVAFNDPGLKPFLPPMPKIGIAPVAGTLNLLLFAALGIWLYRMPPRKDQAAPGSSPG